MLGDCEVHVVVPVKTSEAACETYVCGAPSALGIDSGGGSVPYCES